MQLNMLSLCIFIILFESIKCLRLSPFKFNQKSSSTNLIKKSLTTSVAIISIAVPNAFAVPLGQHSSCAYPACTSQLEILEDNAPNLVSQAEIDSYNSQLKDIGFTFKNFPKLLEQNDYESIRASLRVQPAGSLRLTVRKYKNFLTDDKKKEFMNKYNSMINNLDDMDVLASKRLIGGSTDDAVRRAADNLIQSYDTMMAVVGK